MKKFKGLFAGLMLGLLVLVGIAGSISFNQPVPVTWSTPNGTNAFGLNSDAIPTIMRLGTNYSGITTNFAITNGATVTIKGGIITSVQ